MNLTKKEVWSFFTGVSFLIATGFEFLQFSGKKKLTDLS